MNQTSTLDLPDIAAFLPQEEDEASDGATTEDLREAFHITSEDGANWLLRKLGAIDSERRRVKAQAAEIVAALDKDEQRLRGRFEAELADFARQRLAEKGGKTKTLKLLQGTIAFRTVRGGLTITNEEEAFVCARTSYPDAIETRETLNRARYRDLAKQSLEESGELLPGVEPTPDRESMRIDFGAATGKEAAQ